jgi:putative ABC transport system permease protein
VLSLLLAAVGIYGVLSQSVSQRRSEIGVRLALGAAPSTIVRLVAAGTFLRVGCGVALGLVGAWAAAGTLQRLVFGVSPTEPVI